MERQAFDGYDPNLFPRLRAVGAFVVDHLPTMLPKHILSRGDHPMHEVTGGGPFLDAQLEAQAQENQE